MLFMVHPFLFARLVLLCGKVVRCGRCWGVCVSSGACPVEGDFRGSLTLELVIGEGD